MHIAFLPLLTDENYLLFLGNAVFEYHSSKEKKSKSTP